jgi:hypothetical protein
MKSGNRRKAYIGERNKREKRLGMGGRHRSTGKAESSALLAAE